MPQGKTRCTRRLRSWMVEQVSSGKYSGLVWDDEEKTMFRIPWKHAAKHDFRCDEDAAIFKAWAEFKGKLSDNEPAGPASWKTRLRCALNKSPEFSAVTERSQLDISEPYKVYRLVPLDEQGLNEVKKKEEEKNVRRSKHRKRTGNSEINQESPKVWIKEEEEAAVAVQSISMEFDSTTGSNITLQLDKSSVDMTESNGVIDEIHLNFTVETVPPPGYVKECASFLIRVYYLGTEVLKREVMSDDVRVAFFPPSPAPPSINSLNFPRIPLPLPPSDLTPNQISSITTLLPYMEGGVILTKLGRGVYAKRLCQGRVFWRGPHTLTNTATRMKRGVEPTLIFNKQVFSQELEQFHNGGKTPETEITLCFGEELLEGEDVSKKLVVIKISLPWAEKLKEMQAWTQSISLLQSLAEQSPSGEITLNLVELPEQNVSML